MLSGGKIREINIKNINYLYGDRSVDKYIPKQKLSNLLFKWGCMIIGDKSMKNDKNFCVDKLSNNKATLKIPKNTLTNNMKYNFTLQVVSKQTNLKDMKWQEIHCVDYKILDIVIE